MNDTDILPINKATAYAGGELTCAFGCAGSIYIGATDGYLSRIVDKEDTIRRVRANTTNAMYESDDSNNYELSLTRTLWSVRVCMHAITSVCSIEELNKGTLIIVGSAGGELVILREDLELRRFNLDSAVQHICVDQDGELIAGDLLGNLYGITQHEIIWKRRLPSMSTRNEVGLDYFYPPLSQPTIKAISHVKLLDVEKTLSKYLLVATGQKQLLMTYRGKTFGIIPTCTPIATLTSIPFDDEDIVLAAGEEGVIYRVMSSQDIDSKVMPNFCFVVKKWTQVSFPVAKLLPLKMKVSGTNAKHSDYAYICLGVDGEVALFRGQELVKEWSLASFSKTCNVEADFPVDMTLLHDGDTNIGQQVGIIVYPKRIHAFPIGLASQQ
ncbi:putative quinoprotein alcohol dehydrogenase-like superfamily [Plasmopara halstedii]